MLITSIISFLLYDNESVCMTSISIPNPYKTTSKQAEVIQEETIIYRDQHIHMLFLLPNNQEYIQQQEIINVFKNILQVLKQTIKTFIQPNKKYPSNNQATKKMYVVLDNNTDFKASILPLPSENNQRTFEKIQLNISYYFYKQNPKELPAILTHEFYHPLANIEHEEAQARKELFILHEKFVDPIAEEEKLIHGILDSLEQVTDEELEEIITDIQAFQNIMSVYYQNIVTDAALTVLAIQYKDDEYVNAVIKDDKERVNKYKKAITQLNKTHPNKQDPIRNLLEYMYSVRYMPRECQAAYILGTHPEASNTINDFVSFTRKNCEEKTNKLVLEFYVQFIKRVTQAQTNSKSPQEAIHNKQARKEAAKAYTILERNYHYLCQKALNSTNNP